MRFSEHELTLALTGAARTVASGQGPRRRRGRDPEAAWNALSGYERYQLLDGISGQVLPVLDALPDVDVEAGQRPSFSNRQVLAAIDEALGPVEAGGRLRGKVAVAARLALVRAALAHLPPRRPEPRVPG